MLTYTRFDGNEIIYLLEFKRIGSLWMRKMGWEELSPCSSKHRKEPQHAKMLGKGQCGRAPYREKLVAKALRFSQRGAGPRCGPVPWVAKHLRGTVPDVA